MEDHRVLPSTGSPVIATQTRASDIAERHKLSQNLMVTGWARSLLLQVDGRWVESERALDALDAFEATLAGSGQAVGLAERAIMLELHGRLPELLETLRTVVEFHPAFRELYALALIRDGDREQARRWLGGWSEQPQLPSDYLWTTTTTLRSWVWAALGDPDAVEDLLSQLTPYADRLVYASGTVTFLGSLHLWVGELAVATGDLEAARRHLAQALETHRRLELPFWVARTEAALAGIPAR